MQAHSRVINARRAWPRHRAPSHVVDVVGGGGGGGGRVCHTPISLEGQPGFEMSPAACDTLMCHRLRLAAMAARMCIVLCSVMQPCVLYMAGKTDLEFTLVANQIAKDLLCNARRPVRKFPRLYLRRVSMMRWAVLI
jgi:hypothetical protein